MKFIQLTFLSFLGFGLLAGLSSCSLQDDKPLKIIANSWIGYSPLFYAKEQGWLAQNHIELSTVVSLGESFALYENAGFDAFTGTQFEYQQVKNTQPNLTPILMLDKSNGGDMVMSNGSIDQLKQTLGVIDVYLELNSVNSLIFKDFVKAHALSNQSFNFINKDQVKISTEVSKRAKTTTSEINVTKSPYFLVVTYEPFNHQFHKQGLLTLSSTGDDLTLLVIDALYTDPKTFSKHQKQFEVLKQLIDKSILTLQSNPQDYYAKVKTYLENPSYEEFIASLNSIKWLNQEMPAELVKRLQEAQFPLETIITHEH